jgi:hypothetical protein
LKNPTKTFFILITLKTPVPLYRVWLATYDKQAHPIDSRDEERVRDFIIAKVPILLYIL